MSDEHELDLEPTSQAKDVSSGSSHTESAEPQQIVEPCRVMPCVQPSANTQPSSSQPEVRTASSRLVSERLFQIFAFKSSMELANGLIQTLNAVIISQLSCAIFKQVSVPVDID